ncbi:hypothetical protein ACP4OV_003406 [Aristida adscensionis]
MVLEGGWMAPPQATMICLDNSDWARNGDYRPTRFGAQSDAIAIICGTKNQSNRESTMGVLAMAGKGGPRVLVTPTTDLGKILTSIHRLGAALDIGGEANLTAAIQIAQLALKHRQKKQQQQRIIVFVGSPVKCEKNELEAVGKKLKKNNISLDVIDFGESDDEKPEKLEALVAAVNSGDNSHIVHVPPGEISMTDFVLSSPILYEDKAGSDFVYLDNGLSGFEFGVDPNVDPELALALRISMEEERARQEAAAKKAAEESSKAENKGQSSTSNSDIVMADAESAPNPSTDDLRNQLMYDDDQILQQAHAMSMEEGNSGVAGAADAEMFDIAMHDAEVAFVAIRIFTALQMTLEDGESDTEYSDMNEMLEDQSYVSSVLNSLPGVDPNDLSVKNLLAFLHGHKDKEQEKKEDKTGSDKNQ